MGEILVLGATGKTGRRVAEQLVEQGASVRAASRNPATSKAAEATRFDWDDSATWQAALAGVEAVYIVPPPARVDYAGLVGKLAAKASSTGVSRLVLLSARGADAAEGSPMRQAEMLVEKAGTEWAVVRPSWFMQNFTEGPIAEQIVQADSIFAPAGDSSVAFIDAGDIAAVAAALLTAAAPLGRAYDLSGPEAITWQHAAKLLSAATGRTINYVDLPPEQWEQQAVAAGLPADYAGMMTFLYGLLRQGAETHVSDGIGKVLGRPARSFADFAAAEGPTLSA